MATPLDPALLSRQYQALDQARELGGSRLAMQPLQMQALQADLEAKRLAPQLRMLEMARQDRAQQATERFQNGRLELMAKAPGGRGSVAPSGYRAKPDGTLEFIPGGPADPATKVSIAGPAKLDDESARNLAIESLYDPNATQGFRRDTSTMGQIMKHRTQAMKDAGITPQDVISGRAGFKADTMSLNKITPQYDAITAFENTAIRNGKILTQLVDAVDTTGVPFVEKWIRAGRKATGDPEVAKFDAQINLYRAEVARILTQPNLSGVLTDTARKEAEEFLQGSASSKQIKDVVTLLERDFHNRKETLEDQIGAIRTRMNKRVAPREAERSIAAPGGAPATPAAAGGAPTAGALNAQEQAELEQLRGRFRGARPQ